MGVKAEDMKRLFTPFLQPRCLHEKGQALAYMSSVTSSQKRIMAKYPSSQNIRKGQHLYWSYRYFMSQQLMQGKYKILNKAPIT